MGLPLYKVESVYGGECINCFQCVEACPRKNTKGNLLGQNLDPALASSIAVAAFIGVYALNSGASTLLANSGLTSGVSASGVTNDNGAATVTTTVPAATTAPAVTPAPVSQGKYKDGTYTGTGVGFRNGTTTLSVTIKDGRISSIETLSSQDTPRFYKGAEGTVFSEILSEQSALVNAVSGATYSSNGIISAVRAALAKAV